MGNNILKLFFFCLIFLLYSCNFIDHNKTIVEIILPKNSILLTTNFDPQNRLRYLVKDTITQKYSFLQSRIGSAANDFIFINK